MRTFYRIVKTDPPTLGDFASNQAQRRIPRQPDPDVLRLWDGLSVFDSVDRARQMARLRPRLGRYIATLELPDDSAIRCERTTSSSGHYTVWGEPGAVIGLVVAVEAAG